MMKLFTLVILTLFVNTANAVLNHCVTVSGAGGETYCIMLDASTGCSGTDTGTGGASGYVYSDIAGEPACQNAQLAIDNTATILQSGEAAGVSFAVGRIWVGTNPTPGNIPWTNTQTDASWVYGCTVWASKTNVLSGSGTMHWNSASQSPAAEHPSAETAAGGGYGYRICLATGTTPVDCVGTWSDCPASCAGTRTFSETTAASGGGQTCTALFGGEDGATQACVGTGAGMGACCDGCCKKDRIVNSADYGDCP